MADASEWRLYASKEICMCGSRVDAHGMGDGHSPVSEWDYYAWQEEEAIAMRKVYFSARAMAWCFMDNDDLLTEKEIEMYREIGLLK